MAEGNEFVPLVDDKGIVVGRSLRADVHNGSKMLHPVVHLHVINNRGEILLQKRAESKIIQPGKWDTSVGGHIVADEPVELSLSREAFEEIGLKNTDRARLIITYIFESNIEREFIYCFSIVVDDNFIPKKEESDVSDLKFWSEKEIFDALGTNILTPNFELEYKMISDKLYEIIRHDI